MKRLLEIVAKIQPVTKDKTNPFFKSKYFDINKLLEVLKPLLLEKGLVLLQPLGMVDGKAVLSTMILDLKTGGIIWSEKVPLPDLQDPQKMGSAITYYRRYSLKSLFSIEEEDDDAEQVVRPKVKTPSVATTILKIRKVKTKKKMNEWINYIAKNNFTTQQKNVLKRVIEEVAKTL